jgi:ectoine hydroxylase-related dioxygenase (phytanoyl-CoA dioxygenase family)
MSLDIEKFMRDGWVIVDATVASPFADAQNVTIDNHKELSELMWRNEYSLGLARELLPVVQQLLGLDIMVQYYPYLRIARPHKPQDNIGYHKDTQYGQTPYELAVHIPFVNLDEKSAIRVISGSHLMPESAFERVTADGQRIEKGSIENQMGKPYMPKCLKVPEGMTTTPLVMKVGQVALFSPAIFHGQEINEGDVTRVSCDLRFVSSHHADKVRVGKVHAGYVPVSESPVEMIAAKYYGAQK